MTYFKLPGISLLVLSILLISCSEPRLPNEGIASDLTPKDPALEAFARAQVAFHNEMILAGPAAMESFFAKNNESGFTKGEVNFAVALSKSFSIAPSTLQNLEAAYQPLQHLSIEELRVLSEAEIKRLARNGEVGILHHHSLKQDEDGPQNDCNCGQVVFDSIVYSTLAAAGCISCLDGAYVACPGCLVTAGTAFGILRKAWNCGCFSQDLSPYQ